MLRHFKYRLYPTATQDEALHEQIDEACRLYNSALDERKSAWKMQGINLNYYTQAKQLPEIRATGEFGLANAQVAQDVLKRAQKAFDSFFKRASEWHEVMPRLMAAWKTSGADPHNKPRKPGPPRFRSKHRYDSITFPQYPSGSTVRPSRRLYVQGVGDIKVKWHRPIPDDATIKTVTVKREAGRWHVSFGVELPEAEPLPSSTSAIGLDLGLSTFVVCSDGSKVDNPRHYRLAERRLRLAQRKLARRKKRSRRRLKARQEIARVHVHIANQRRDFHHQTARVLVEEHGLIAVEDLNVKGLAGSMLAKSVHDAGWGQFVSILSTKAEEAGRILVKVNPNGTTQRCSSCGDIVPKTLADRWHSCACGLRLGRDHNAALNILHLAQGLGWSLQAPTVGVTRAVA